MLHKAATISISQPIMYFKVKLLICIRTGAHLALFLWDYISCIGNDRHTAAPTSYRRLRQIYALTKGKSAKFLSIPFQVLYPSCKHDPIPYISGIVESIVNHGYCKLDATSDISEAAEILHRRLSLCSVQEVLPGFEQGFLYENLEAALESSKIKAARLVHDRNDVCLIPETWKLIHMLKLREIASSYLRCDPILTSVDSWHVIPIAGRSDSDDLYSAAAQTYHYDMDWIKFLKIFINLTPAPMESGPFEFIAYSHEKKNNGYFRDGRFEQLLDPCPEIAFAVGNVGSCFFADTSGLHRDGRASTANRHVLQIEFAVSSFGAKFQYDDIYKKCSKAVQSVKNNFPSSSRMFALF